MFVYRVEMRASFLEESEYDGSITRHQNYGPYRGDMLDIDACGYLEELGFYLPYIHLREDDHPIPQDDRRLNRGLDRESMLDDYDITNLGYYFGFTSKQKLARWFDKYDREKLHNAGFGCFVYDARNHDAIAGNKQAIFKLKRSELLAFIPLTEIY